MMKTTVLWNIVILFAPAIAQNDGDIRLRDGASSAEGRLEIYHNYEWGTICDDYFDMADADVACRQLGYNKAQEVKEKAYFGYADSKMQIWLDNMDCYGEETSLTYCSSLGWGNGNCIDHSKDVGIICTYSSVQEGALRLVDGEDLDMGRVEINHNGVWGTICNDYWSWDEGHVACRQLGYNDVYNPKTSSYGPGEDPIHLDNVGCSGDEDTLLQCYHREWGDHNCDHSDDVGIQCRHVDENDNNLPGWAIFLIIFGCATFCVILTPVLNKVCPETQSKPNASAADGEGTNSSVPMQTYRQTDDLSPVEDDPPPADDDPPPSYSTVVPATPMPQPDGAEADSPSTVNVPEPEVNE